jgi:hypothetical protein
MRNLLTINDKMVYFEGDTLSYCYKLSDLISIEAATDTIILMTFKSTFHHFPGDSQDTTYFTVTKDSHEVVLNFLKVFSSSKSLIINIKEVDDRISSYFPATNGSKLPVLALNTGFTHGPGEYPGSGLRAASGFKFNSSKSYHGNIVKTAILMDITDLSSTADDGDVIGNGTDANCWMYQVGTGTNHQRGGFLDVAGTVTCLQAPAGGDTDIDFYEDTSSTRAGGYDISGADKILNKGGAWAAGDVIPITAPPSNSYVYMASGGGSSAGTYTAGIFLIEFYGICNANDDQ